MLNVAYVSAAIAALVVAALFMWRRADNQADDAAWANLASRQPSTPAVFDPAMVSGLPGPAQRFFDFTIKPGTPLFTVAEIAMEGDFSLGTQTAPNYMPMVAQQILASPHGFVWTVSAGRGLMRFSGSDAGIDGNSWSHFWLLDIAPVGRAGGNLDHRRATFGRYIAEGLIWSPAAFLPSGSVRWEPLTDSTARVFVTHMGLEQAVDLTVDTQGRPSKVKFQRWSNANPDKVFQLQPFGAYLSEFKRFKGFQLPTRVEAGNLFETDTYFPFFRVNVTSICFPEA